MLSGSVFRNWLSDFISLETESNGQSEYFNSDKAVAGGVEVELDGHLASGIKGRASYSYVDAEESATHQILTNSLITWANWS